MRRRLLACLFSVENYFNLVAHSRDSARLKAAREIGVVPMANKHSNKSHFPIRCSIDAFKMMRKWKREYCVANDIAQRELLLVFVYIFYCWTARMMCVFWAILPNSRYIHTSNHTSYNDTTRGCEVPSFVCCVLCASLFLNLPISRNYRYSVRCLLRVWLRRV